MQFSMNKGFSLIFRPVGQRASRFWLFWAVFLLLLTVPAAADSPQAVDAAKGDALLKEMSAKLAAARSFGFSTNEFHDGVKPHGERIQLHATRDVLVRRPNGFWSKFSGDRDWEIWYDGKHLTGVSNEKKVYIQKETPPTIDETLTMLAQKLNMDLPMSDVLYSSPYDAFMNEKTTGGFTGKEEIDGLSCNRLTYTGMAVDWQLWINDKDTLPCRLEMNYKAAKGKPFHRITFHQWNLKPEISADAFVARIPEGYVNIPMLERGPIQTTPKDKKK